MNIILEGCDGTGKTSIARYFCEQCRFLYWHESCPRTYDEYVQMLSSGQNIVFDRFCYGQFIYNDPSERKLTEADLIKLQQDIFPKTHTVVLYVDLGSDKIADRLESRKESVKGSYDRESLIKAIKNIRGGYTSLFRRTKASYIKIDGEALCYKF